MWAVESLTSYYLPFFLHILFFINGVFRPFYYLVPTTTSDISFSNCHNSYNNQRFYITGLKPLSRFTKWHIISIAYTKVVFVQDTSNLSYRLTPLWYWSISMHQILTMRIFLRFLSALPNIHSSYWIIGGDFNPCLQGPCTKLFIPLTSIHTHANTSDWKCKIMHFNPLLPYTQFSRESMKT